MIRYICTIDGKECREHDCGEVLRGPCRVDECSRRRLRVDPVENRPAPMPSAAARLLGPPSSAVLTAEGRKLMARRRLEEKGVLTPDPPDLAPAPPVDADQLPPAVFTALEEINKSLARLTSNIRTAAEDSGEQGQQIRELQEKVFNHGALLMAWAQESGSPGDLEDAEARGAAWARGALKAINGTEGRLIIRGEYNDDEFAGYRLEWGKS